MAQVKRVQRYHPRACFHGVMHWTCVWCGNHNASRIHPELYTVRCTGCEGSFIPAIAFYPLPLGRPRPPADWTVPNGDRLREAFPLGELVLTEWHPGDPVHRLVSDVVGITKGGRAGLDAQQEAARLMERVRRENAQQERQKKKKKTVGRKR